MSKGFIKIMDKELAFALAASGFFYIEEEINHGTVVYVFEKTDDINSCIDTLMLTSDFSEVEVVTVEEEDLIL